jgi:glucan phosphoethanolaminetransferase (alkaline phosphatase superfamily)
MALGSFGGPRTTAFALGTLLHILVLKNFELDVYIPHFLLICLISFTALCLAQIKIGVQVLTAISNVTSISTWLAVGIFTSMIVYRLFFHRIRRFPGPLLARISRFYAFYLSGKNVQYHVELSKLHKEYGDFIRTGKLMSGTSQTRDADVTFQGPAKYA